MVITGAILALIGALLPIVLGYVSLGFLGASNLMLVLTAILALISLFARRHPSLGVLITVFSVMSAILTRWDIVVVLTSSLSVLGGFLIILRSHDDWMAQRKESYRMKLEGGAR